ncbi:hypothetical protein BC477_01660 [Clavibacter michiganensis subsp. michiganensis]|uniref:Uncharacterized protein n=1 Tax=Clavibacter michiganensis subsp. michiganensis TaxID=33013 RepID=A0A251XIM4_CLAMM|nr:hypothetical protein BC477_01660 [Clavibacter michiganensis subsp. michiganensis]OUE03414.1 hypothetical protein CMMCAS07_00595 [Clavibacter michiganensis subsp. michiganensis]
MTDTLDSARVGIPAGPASDSPAASAATRARRCRRSDAS